MRGTAPDVAGLPEAYRWLLSVRADPRGPSPRDRDHAEIEAALFGPSGGRFLAREDGSFETWLTPGAWHIHAVLDEHEPVRSDVPQGPHASVQVGSAPVNDVRVPRWPRVEGRVVHPEGVGIGGAIVCQGERWDAQVGRTSAEGRFSVRRLLARDPRWTAEQARDGWPLVVKAFGFQRRAIPGPRLAADPLVVPMSPGGDVVVEARTPAGEPVLHGGIYQPASDPEPGGDQFLADFDQEGRARVRGLAAGDHVLGVMAGWPKPTQVRAAVRTGETSALSLELVVPARRRPLRAHVPPGVRLEEARSVWFSRMRGFRSQPDLAADGTAWFWAPQPRLAGPSTLFLEHEGSILAAPWDLEPAEAPLEFSAESVPLRLLHLRFEDPSGTPLYVHGPLPLVTVGGGAHDAPLPLHVLGAFHIGKVGRFSLFDRKSLDDSIARWHPGVQVEGLELFITEAQDAHGITSFVAPTFVPLPTQVPIRLAPLASLTVTVLGPDGPVPFASVSARIERAGELTRVPDNELPTWHRATGSDGNAYVPRDPNRALVVEVSPTLEFRSLDGPIVVPPGAGSPLVLRVGKW
ncbi:MAG: hypothetical protein AB7T63_13470 [Planctomycetota bacterium]